MDTKIKIDGPSHGPSEIIHVAKYNSLPIIFFLHFDRQSL